MQSRKAHQLQKAWGDRVCSHPSTAKEYHLGGDTGDRVCTVCGAVVDGESDRNSSRGGPAEEIRPS